MRKLGFSQKTLSLMTESQIEMILEKIKKKETKEATAVVTQKTTINPQKDTVPPGTPFETAAKILKKGTEPEGLKKTVNSEKNIDTSKTPVKDYADDSELAEGKKKKKKYNPWAVCTASVGRKNKKKFEDCVMGVKKKLKEGRNPYEYLIESKMEEIVENNLSPKMTKGEIMSIIAEKKMMMRKPIGTMIGGEMGEGDTKTAPTRTTPKTEPGTRPSHPGRKSKEQPNPKPKAGGKKSDSEMESKKSEIITAIFNLIDKESK